MLREYLSNIADKFRTHLDTTEPINAQDFADKINEVKIYGWNKGMQEGYNLGLEECRSKHYVGTAYGSGDGLTISFDNLPFKPDYIYISSIEPKTTATALSFFIIVVDMNTCLENAGYLRVMNEYGTGTSGSYWMQSVLNLNLSYDETTKKFTYREKTYKYRFVEGNLYTMVAIKTNQTIKERTIEQINRLPNASTGNAITFNTQRVNENFTTEEWESLIATKPNWTFALV